jgi:hypothetical protein
MATLWWFNAVGERGSANRGEPTRFAAMNHWSTSPFTWIGAPLAWPPGSPEKGVGSL